MSVGPGNLTDWVGLFVPGTADTAYLAWQYLDGQQTPPTLARSTATLTFPVPTAGRYEFRFFANNAYTRLAISDPVIATCVTGVTPGATTATSGAETLTMTGSAPADCAWSASSASSFVTVTSGATGSGARPVSIALPAHTGATARSGVLDLGGREVPVVQQAGSVAAVCATVSPTTISIGAQGGVTSVDVTADAACARRSVSDSAVLHVTRGLAGSGSRSVSVLVPANPTGTPRTGTLLVAGTPVTVTQDGQPKAGTPTLSLTPGTYRTTQTLSVTGPASSMVRYTTTGAVPTEADPVFPSALTIGQNATITVRAFISGVLPSDPVVGAYVLQPLPPVLSPGPGAYALPLAVSVAGDGLSTLRYTTDGSVPTDTAAVYTAPLALTGAATVTARAFRAGWTPSAPAAASYTIVPPTLAPPTITPPPGVYTTAQTVTLQASGGATIRYTLDGSSPTASAAVYTGPLTVASPVTVSARAFQAGWTDSTALVAPYTFPSAAPVATPSGGALGPAQTVTLHAAPGSAIHYTVDGSTPSAASALYTAPFTLAASATVQAIAIQPGWAPSAVTTASYTSDTTGPTVTMTYVPPPSSAGWHHTPVTVTFTCSDAGAGVASCPGPVLFDTEGASQSVNVTATDLVGNSTNSVATVSVDLTAPVVAIASPATDITTSDSTINLTGAATDLLSGTAEVSCNGVPGTLAAGAIGCVPSLGPGRNAVVVVVRDVAGHSASAGITVTRVGAATTLRVDPGTRTLVVGESQPLTVRDEYGVGPNPIIWSSSDPLVATIDASGLVTAVAAGTVTITATAAGQQAIGSVTVLSGFTLPVGTVRWTVAPSSGRQMQSPLYTHRTAATVPDLFSVETDAAGDVAVRAVSASGVSLWSGPSPGWPIMGDVFGGVIAELTGPVAGLARFGGPVTAPPWRYESPGQISQPAQAPDGTIYLVETLGNVFQAGAARFFVALNGQTGQVVNRALLSGYLRATDYYGINVPPRRDVYAPAVTAPVVGADGRGYLQTARYGFHDEFWAHYTEPPAGAPPAPNINYIAIDRVANTYDHDVSLVSLGPSGAAITRSLDVAVLTDDDADGQLTAVPVLTPRQTVPDGLGGLLATWRRGTEHTVTRFAADWARQDHALPDADAEIVLTGDSGTAYYRSPTLPLTAVDVATWTPKWTTTAPGDPVMALPGGGVALQSGAVASAVGSQGTVIETFTLPMPQPIQLASGVWAGLVGGQLAAHVSNAMNEPVFSFSQHQGNAQRQSAPNIQMTITINTFIPEEWVDTPTEWLAFLTSGTWWSGDSIFEGDHRTSWDIDGRSRTKQDIVVNNVGSVRTQTGVGETRLYHKTSSLDGDQHITAAAKADTISGDGQMLLARGWSSDKGTATATRLPDGKLQVEIELASGNPLFNLVFPPNAINYQARLIVDFATMTYSFTVAHDGFPKRLLKNAS